MNIDFRVHLASALAAVALGGLLVLVVPSNATDRARLTSVAVEAPVPAAADGARRAPMGLALRVLPGEAQGLVLASGGGIGLRAPQAWPRFDEITLALVR